MANTGNITVTEKDINPFSPTYNQERTRTYADTERCPLGTSPKWVEISRVCEQSDPGTTERNFLCQWWSHPGNDKEITYTQVDCGDDDTPCCCYKLITGDCATSVGYESDISGFTYAGLTYVDLGRTVTAINDYVYSSGTTGVFEGCKKLKTLIVRNTTPPTVGSHTFYNISTSLLKIYVPDESVNAYKTANGWTGVADLIHPISDLQ